MDLLQLESPPPTRVRLRLALNSNQRTTALLTLAAAAAATSTSPSSSPSPLPPPQQQLPAPTPSPISPLPPPDSSAAASASTAVVDFPTKNALLTAAKNKLNLKRAPKRIFLAGGFEPPSEAAFWQHVTNDSTVLISLGEDYIGKPHSTSRGTPSSASSPSSQANELGPLFEVRVHDNVLFLLFRTSRALEDAVGRAHRYYEGRTLKGPLKGVNMPLSTMKAWRDDVLKASSKSFETADAAAATASTCAPPRSDPTAGFSPQELQALDACGLSPSAPASSAASDPHQHQHQPALLYVIAALSSDRSTLVHEWAHARFHLDGEYRALCESTHASLSPAFARHVEKTIVNVWNYAPEAVVDEFQAYVVEGPVATVFGRKWMREVGECRARLKGPCGECPMLR
ncbi:hypothetical protein DFJ73DRAFT_664498 [Zopfochytrium polystomum]|nr:hypothetical protein DFJ73DRAFT_664498 [Zopfochytrium polystomum]